MRNTNYRMRSQLTERDFDAAVAVSRDLGLVSKNILAARLQISPAAASALADRMFDERLCSAFNTRGRAELRNL